MSHHDHPSRSHAAIIAAVEDYIHGWYQGEPARTERCLHPQLAKRQIQADATIAEIDAATLISYVQKRAGTAPPETQQQEIAILGVYGNIASARRDERLGGLPAPRLFRRREEDCQCDLDAETTGGATVSSEQQPAQSLNVSESIRAKRAVRQYQATPVPTEIIEAILDAGRRAQSSKNDQPWTFVVVRERAQLQRLSATGSYAAHMAASAFTVVLVAPTGYEFDLGQAAAYMQLVAVDHGVGSCVTVLHDHAAARSVLGVPEDLTCRWTVTFGYPSEAPSPLRKGGAARSPTWYSTSAIAKHARGFAKPLADSPRARPRRSEPAIVLSGDEQPRQLALLRSTRLGSRLHRPDTERWPGLLGSTPQSEKLFVMVSVGASPANTDHHKPFFEPGVRQNCQVLANHV
ncbi:hypothetical protein HC891_14335 [Candidatus Gracilibacteria bacterium]|nr:hypothetical protein [Candidatus Gracilibacteria bacterium]